MYEFKFENLSSGRCISTVIMTIKSMDPHATTVFDVSNNIARVNTVLDPNTIGAAIAEAGFPSTFRKS